MAIVAGWMRAATVMAAFGLAATAEARTIDVDLGQTGGGQSFSTQQPSLALTPLVKTEGLFDELGRVQWFAGNFAPRGFAAAEGQLLSIAQNTALFAKLGTIYGGDGRTTFGLPDLRGRSILGIGTNGQTGTQYRIGQKVGVPSVALTEAQMPSHQHDTGSGPSSLTGGGQSHTNMQPSLVLDYEVAVQGVFPSRNMVAPEAGEVGTGNELIGMVSIDAANDADFDGTRADGTRLQIAQNSALFAILGTTYGGDGRTDFAVPDLAGRLAVGQGSGPALTPRALGQQGGTETETLSIAQMPSHMHTDPKFGVTGATGGGQSVNSIQPELALNYVIALQGIFPSRNLMARDADLGVGNSTSSPFLAEVALFAGNFAPRGWAFAHGQLLPINQNQSLFSLLGTTYGGDGRTTFALPDLRGRTAIGAGDGPGLPMVRLGERFGAERNFLSVGNLPSHNHTVERVVPLPASLALLAGAVAALGALRRRPGRAA